MSVGPTPRSLLPPLSMGEKIHLSALKYIDKLDGVIDKHPLVSLIGTIAIQVILLVALKFIIPTSFLWEITFIALMLPVSLAGTLAGKRLTEKFFGTADLTKTFVGRLTANNCPRLENGHTDRKAGHLVSCHKLIEIQTYKDQLF